jgi:hypothetical protein
VRTVGIVELPHQLNACLHLAAKSQEIQQKTSGGGSGVWHC